MLLGSWVGARLGLSWGGVSRVQVRVPQIVAGDESLEHRTDLGLGLGGEIRVRVTVRCSVKLRGHKGCCVYGSVAEEAEELHLVRVRVKSTF